MNKKGLQIFSALGAFTTIYVTVVELSNYPLLTENKGILYFALVAIILSVLIGYFIIQNILPTKTKKLKISVLGRPNVGKTVFITVLFNELLRIKDKKYEFYIPDKKTVEIVLGNMKMLSDGHWLARTCLGGEISYKGIFMENKITKQKYDLEITDFPGEQFNHIEKKEYWSHNEPFFEYILDSQIIYLTVGVEQISDRHWSNYDYIASVNLLLYNSNQTKINQPIVLLFLKSDLIGESDEIKVERQVIEHYQPLIDFCSQKCKFFNYHFVSSVGKSAKNFRFFGEEKKAKEEIKLTPNNVIESFLWSLSKLKI